VFAASRRGDRRRPAELPHHQDQGAVEQAPCLQVVDQCINRAVDARQERLEALDQTAPDHVVAVVVEEPEEAADDHEGDTRLDQPPRQKSALAQGVTAVQIPDPFRFLVDLKSLARFTGKDH
jgi:hypothetical protein